MTRYQRCARTAMAVLLVAAAGALVLQAQSSNALLRLRAELRARYDIVALQDGVALIPRQRDAGVRMIEIRDGAVAIDGTAVTARELRDRLGRDADAILRVTYLDAAAQRELTGAAAAAPEPPPLRAIVERQVRRQGDVVRVFGGNVTVPRDERIRGDVVAVGGSAEIDGEVSGDVTVVGGVLSLGPDAVVRGDVAVVGGTLRRAPGAQIEGSIKEVGVGRGNGWRRLNVPGLLFGSFVQRVGSLVGTLLRITLMILIAFVVVAAGGHATEYIAERVGAEPVRSMLAGLLAELMFVPMLIITVVVLAISLVGIPLLVLVPFGVVLFLLVLTVGFTGVAYQVGGMLMRRFGLSARGAYATVALGVLAISGVTLVARLAAVAGGFLVGGPLSAVGFLIEYAAWTIGLGASIVTWLNMRQRRAPATPVPSPSS